MISENICDDSMICNQYGGSKESVHRMCVLQEITTSNKVNVNGIVDYLCIFYPSDGEYGQKLMRAVCTSRRILFLLQVLCAGIQHTIMNRENTFFHELMQRE